VDLQRLPDLHYMQEPIHPGGVCQRCADRYRGALDAAAELNRVWPGLQGDHDPDLEP